MRSMVNIKYKGEAVFHRFASIGELANECERIAPKAFHLNAEKSKGGGKNSFEGSTVKQALERVRTGNPDLVAASDKILSVMEREITPTSSAFEMQAAVAGGVVNVPAMLAGHPATMRLRKRVEDQYAPIAIIIDVTVSAGVDHETIARRGAAALALVRALQGSRPVSLLVTGGLRQSGTSNLIVTEIDTAPLDLARAAWVLGAPEYLRRVLFAFSDFEAGNSDRNAYIQWAFDDHDWQLKHLPGWLAAYEGFEDFVPVPGVLIGTTFKSDREAAQWVVSKVRELTREKV